MSTNLPNRLGSFSVTGVRRSLRPHGTGTALLVFALALARAQAGEQFPANDPPLPHLAEPSQVQDPEVYRSRREALMKELGEGVAVVFCEGSEDSSGFRAGTDFFYLTGVNDPEAVLVLAPKERTYREFLLLPSRDPEAERWTGEREPINTALRKRYGFEKIFRTGRLTGLVLGLAERSPVLWQIAKPEAGGEKKPADLEFYGKITSKLAAVTIRSRPLAVARMRSRHSADELAIMQRTVRISEAGFRAAAQAIRPGVSEGEVRAEAERVWKSMGARRTAYPSIVGSGPNSTILHYPKSERVMQDGELILLDMAAEYAHYAADITRTLPVNGRFTPAQRKIYDLVLKAQQTAFAAVKPGVYMEDLDAIARKVIDDAGYGDYFIHGLGHFVGLDVHDAGAYQEPLEVGMVITLEPGIYLPEQKFGVRIEDDVVVTETGAKYLTDGLPREPEAIEAWMASRPASTSR